jgi:hypothetical protein
MPFVLLISLWIAQAADQDPSQLGQKHGCTADGRYWVHEDKGKKVYCWEGAGFNEKSAPPHVKTYFDPGPTSAPQTRLPDIMLNPVAGVTPTAPTVKKPAAGGGTGGGAAGGGGAANPKTTSFTPNPKQGSFEYRGGKDGTAKVKDTDRALARDPASANSMAPGRREIEPVSMQVLAEIENGMERATVLDRLGDPHGKILNTGDEGTLEIWTYAVRGGGYASVRLQEGRVIKIARPR